MKPEIKFKKVIVDGERAYKVLSINGVKHVDDLPNAYLEEGARFAMRDGAFTIVSFHVEFTVAIGDVITEPLEGIKHEMKKAAARLKNINLQNAADADGWEGTASIALKE